MGGNHEGGFRGVSESRAGNSPGRDELEVTLLGPGYGESVVLHIGDGNWIIVDSCIDGNGDPRSLRYVESLGVDPSRAVGLIVATHWHDDHIRGMSRLVEVCERAAFCCAAALRETEFLAVVAAWARHDIAADGSGVREIHGVIDRLRTRSAKPRFALANRRIFAKDTCEVWSLSPGDADFGRFLESVGVLLPRPGQTKTRVPFVSPNDVAVVLWVGIGDVGVLLGSDLERSAWIEILQSVERPGGSASVFKVPHHGSASAHEDGVWRRMLDAEPFAVLTPWRKGGHVLPRRQDARRILAHTGHAFATANPLRADQTGKRRDPLVARALREAKARLREQPILAGMTRLRRHKNPGSEWKVELFGPACHLSDFVA